MNKCEHNEKITIFCISEHCEWKQAAGCPSCIKKYHNHYSHSKFLQQQDLIDFMNGKFSMQTAGKPNCRKIQQSLYSYFTALKNQFASSLDLLCKSLINCIGSPYLTEHHLFHVYKRVKNKEYKRLQTKDFRKFYETAKKLNPSDVNKEQSKLYKQQLKKSQKIIHSLESILSSYESLFKQSSENFSHEKSVTEGLASLLKQTIQNSQITINLSLFHEKQMEKNKAERAQRQHEKTQKQQEKNDKQQKHIEKKSSNQYDSILSTQYSSRLPSNTKEKQKSVSKGPQLSFTPLKKKQDLLYDSFNHKFGVRDFTTMDKPDNTTKRVSSLDKKVSNISVQIQSKNDKKRTDLNVFDDVSRNDYSNNKAERQKISFPQKYDSFLVDVYGEGSGTKKSQVPPTSFLTDKKQPVLKENEILMRKQQLIEMMKNHTTFGKNVQREREKSAIEKPQNIECGYNSVTHENSKFKAPNSNGLMHKHSMQLANDNSKRNASLFLQEKRHKPEVSMSTEKPMRNEEKKRSSETKNMQNLANSLSNRLESQKSPLVNPSYPSIHHIPEDTQKSSNGSLGVIKKILPKKNMNAHPNLPIDQFEQKPKQLACSRLIIVPTNSKFPVDKSDQSDSPLLKRKGYNHTQGKNCQKFLQKNGRRQYLTSKDDKSQLKEQEQRSLYLLIKSIQQKPEEAMLTLELGLKQAPNNLSAAQYLSYLYLQNSKPKEALTTCNVILDRFQMITKENEQLLINLENNKAAALNMLGRYSQAVVLLERCIKIKQKDTMFKNLADAYYFSSNYEKAIFYYEKTIQLSPCYDEAYYNMGVCLYLQGNFHNSKQSVLKAIEIAPRNSDYLQLKKHVDDRINQSANQ